MDIGDKSLSTVVYIALNSLNSSITDKKEKRKEKKVYRER